MLGTFNRWHQVLTVVYPPGTVAVLRVAHLPVQGAVRESAVGGDTRPGSAQYAWEMNRLHVSQVVRNTAATDRALSSEVGSISCSAARFVPGLYPYRIAIPGVLVLLADPACIASRSCSPVVPPGLNYTDPAYDAVVQAWIREQASRPAWQRKARLACMPMADFADQDSQPRNYDLMHFDYPAAAESRAAQAGGEWTPGYPVQRGQWHGRKVSANASETQPAGSATAAAPEPWYLQAGSVNPLLGPVARYRGAALHRIEPPPANQTLPRIDGGSWVCNSTSNIGAFRFRPVCRMECDDASLLPVDVGLERWARREEARNDAAADTGTGSGWRLVLGTARVWHSFWTGFPGMAGGPPVDGSGSQQPSGIVA